MVRSTLVVEQSFKQNVQLTMHTANILLTANSVLRQTVPNADIMQI